MRLNYYIDMLYLKLYNWMWDEKACYIKYYNICVEKDCDYKDPEWGVNNNRTNCIKHKTDKMFNTNIFTRFFDDDDNK